MPEPSLRPFGTLYLIHRSCRQRPPITVVSIHQASSAFAEHSPWAALHFWTLCPSPSQVRHLRSACPTLDFLHPNSDLPHPSQCHMLEDRSDCL